MAIILCVFSAGCFGKAEDDDGIEKNVERQGYDIQVRGPDGSLEGRHVQSSPYRADSDRDGLDDFTERLERTDPSDADTDDDGLLDGYNVVLRDDHPCVDRWTKAGIVARELDDGRIEFLGERGSTSTLHGGDPLNADTDGDGLLDGEEVGGFLIERDGVSVVVHTLAYAEDTDGDTLWDGFEREYGTDPSLPDTDQDGVADGQDLDPTENVKVRVAVERFTITDDPEGRSQRDVWLKVQLPDRTFESEVRRADRGVDYSGATLSSEPMDIADSGGDVRAGSYNFTFAATFLSTDAAGRQQLLDVFSGTGDEGSLFGQLHARDGTLRLVPPFVAGEAPWPPSAIFSGPHGSITLRLELASTA